MITELKRVLEKYKIISERSEYVSVQDVICDLHRLMMEARLKRIPMRDR